MSVRPSIGTATLVAVGDIAPWQQDGHITDLGPADEDLREGDLRVGNLEAVLTSQPQAVMRVGATLSAPPSTATWLARYFDCLAVANNHALDFGPQALAESLRHLEQSGIGYCGAGPTLDSAERPWCTVVRGVRVGVLSFADRYGGTKSERAEMTPAASHSARVLSAIRDLRSTVDMLVLQLHWGYEFSVWPLLSHRDAARAYVDAGADLVLCHHAHVPMGAEVHGDGAILYGLGNFLFEPNEYHRSRSHLTGTSVVAHVSFSERGVHRVELRPYRLSKEIGFEPLRSCERRALFGLLGSVSRRLRDEKSLALLEHHHRLADLRHILQHLSEDDPWLAEQSSAWLGCPVWTDNLRYLSEGPAAVRDSIALLSEVRELGAPVFSRARHLRERLLAECSFAPVDPATTGWWLP